ncbi:hypothetical protein [Actinomycetospora flava]|uniref:Uncharacterized protein n=1 Tax=Actinomycetospora flava TaxID=3129232 RepID=A0ABU8LYS9_9PSEU
MIPRAAARPLALAAVVLTAVSVLVSLYVAIVGAEFAAIGAVLAVITLGELAAAVAVVACGAAGRGALAVTGLVVTAVGQLGFFAAHIINLIDEAAAAPLYATAPIVTGVGMVVLGIAVLRAQVFDGFARALPLLVGLWMLVIAIPTIIIVDGPPALAAVLTLVVWDLLWLGTAVAVLTHVRTATRVPVA